MINNNSNLAKNTFMVMLLNISKIALPFLTLPYLTRVLSTDCYGTVSYVKAVMGYMQTLVDFGFLLCATKYVTRANGDKEQIGYIVGDNILAKLIIGFIGMIILIVLCMCISILKLNVVFVFLSYIPILLTIFLLDFLFRGLEKMEIITYRFILMKGISTILTFIFVKNDSNILWIPLLDIIGSIIAVLLVFNQVKKEQIKIKFTGIKRSFELIKESFVYFFSSVASMSFNVFNTIVLGITLSTTDVAYWSICMQCMSAVQALLNPVADAIFPEMVKTRSKQKFKKVMKIFVPLVLIGSILSYVLTPIGLYIVGGEKYIPATPIFRILTPVIFFSFLAIMYGWPVSAAIGREKEIARTTIISVLFQISAILLTITFGNINLYVIAIIRTITEILLFSMRYYNFKKYEYVFNK